MNNLRKTAVLFLIGVMTLSMVLVPFTPVANVDSSQVAPPDYKQEIVQRWADRIRDNPDVEKVDPILTSYLQTGVLDDKVVTTANGDIKLLLYLDPAFDINALDGIANVRWQIDLKLSRVASVDVSSDSALKAIQAMDGIMYVQADVYRETQPARELTETVDPNMFHIRDVVGATGTYASAYDGTDVIVGVDDTGIDFSAPDLDGAESHNGTVPWSYDPSSLGLTEMVLANSTVVENATAWLEAGNLLTYEVNGSYYLNVTGWDPVLNNGLSHRSLMG
ncbi:MAG: hypothetical protein DRP09_05135, partial [Candidatus Thorarchaeota archaeon]